MASTRKGKSSKILITGGHMTPAIAVLRELQRRGYRSFLWAGIKYDKTGSWELSPEYQTLAAITDVRFINFKPGKLVRSWNQGEFLAFLLNLARIPWGFIRAKYIILRFRPDIIISFGGYVALPLAVM